MVKHASHENKGNAHQREDISIFEQILPTSTIYKKYMENSEKTMHTDIGALKGLSVTTEMRAISSKQLVRSLLS